jgi:hypothetical protein
LLYVDGTQTVRDDYGDRSVTDEDEQPDLARELIEEMRSRISSLEYQLSEERVPQACRHHHRAAHAGQRRPGR